MTYPMLVVATSYESPLSCLGSIAQHLRDEAFEGSVLFDLLCTNGLEDNRFVALYFDGMDFVRNTFRLVDKADLSPDLLHTQDKFFAEHPDILQMSLLNQNEVQAFTARH
ncbi:type II toxin-antitoxin system RnlB family antitoxin [Edwardsiella ictaluri]|uniref:type II toxin-antitoxin system RnlB family antitoxin n=1 Tax=Edwardsiella ictaluri TaxID=67780 RepID=UPI0039F6FCBB